MRYNNFCIILIENFRSYLVKTQEDNIFAAYFTAFFDYLSLKNKLLSLAHYQQMVIKREEVSTLKNHHQNKVRVKVFCYIFN